MAYFLATPSTLKVDLWCSDSWLSSVDPEGNPNPDGSSWYWDTRSDRPNPIDSGWINIGEDGVCGGNTMGFTIPQIWGSPTDVITLCDDIFTSTWNSQQSDGSTLQNVCAVASVQGTSIDSLLSDKLARVVVHEFTHSVNAVNMITSLGESPISKCRLIILASGA